MPQWCILLTKITCAIGDRQIHLSAPTINPDISYSTIQSSVIKGPFFAGGTEKGLKKGEKETVQAVIS